MVGGLPCLEPGAVYLLPVRLVTLVAGLHVLRPVGVLDGTLSIRVTLRREG